MKAFVVFALFSLLVLPAKARLGNSETLLTQRYGTPIYRTGEAVPALTYSFDGWVITCEFVGGVCARVSYSKPGEWTEETFDKLLSANGALSTWTVCGSPNLKKLMRTWKRDDGTVATWVVGCLSVTSPHYEKAKAAAEKEALLAATNA